MAGWSGDGEAFGRQHGIDRVWGERRGDDEVAVAEASRAASRRGGDEDDGATPWRWEAVWRRRGGARRPERLRSGEGASSDGEDRGDGVR